MIRSALVNVTVLSLTPGENVHAIVLTSLLSSLTLYPLNPTEQDTVAAMNLHITAGVAMPNEVSDIGPEASINFEYLLEHPFVLRTTLDYRIGNMKAVSLPEGKAHAAGMSMSVLYYRGTYSLIGYVGVGLVYSFGWFDTEAAVDDSLLANDNISGFDVTNSPGYRFIFGLRHRHHFSIEIRLTELRPDLITTRRESPTGFSEFAEPLKIHDVRLSVGYLIPLSGR